MPKDSDNINVLVENIERAAKLRQRWLVTYHDKLQRCASLEKPKNYTDLDVMTNAMLCELPTMTTHFSQTSINRRLSRLSDLSTLNVVPVPSQLRLPTLEDSGPFYELPPPVMKPVDPSDLEVLKENNGREIYLRRRNKIDPDDRFNEPLCTSWVHGWGFRSSCFGRPSPKYGRQAFLLKGAKSRSGPNPDPHTYKALLETSTNKCCNL